ncbi:SCO family protein [Nocardioides sp. LHG3406-4]|uniref:SCO family protein n=1 Tax=Nocardioides sp. LHG3406-4 TaxID=2804575 RepID=UPI003CF16282
MPRSLLGLLVAALLVSGCGAAGQVVLPPDEDGLHGARLDQPYTVPTAPLTATDGSPYSLADSTDKPLTLVFFGYTSCPDICSIVMSSLASAVTRLDDAQRAEVDVVFVTTDPAVDDREKVRRFVDRFDPDFVGLTGDLDTIIANADSLAIAVEKGEKLPSGGYEVAHGTQVVGITADDRAHVVWTEETSAAEFADDIKTLLDEGA